MNDAQTNEVSWKRKALAAFGAAWIVAIGAWVVSHPWPLLWKIATVEYGAIGLASVLGEWRGRYADPAWAKRMRRVQLGGFVVAAALLIVRAQ